MTTCLAFVFGALIEYSIVNVLTRKADETAKKREVAKILAKSLEMNKLMKKQGSEGKAAVGTSLVKTEPVDPDAGQVGQLKDFTFVYISGS